MDSTPTLEPRRVQGILVSNYLDVHFLLSLLTFFPSTGHTEGDAHDKKPYDYFDIDAKTFASWNIDSLKVDGCNIKPDHWMDQQYYAFGKALNATKRPIVYYCSAPFFQAAHAKPPMEPKEIDFKGMREHCNGWRMYVDIKDSWESVLGIVDFYNKNWIHYKDFQGPGAWFDPDMIIVGMKV